MIAVLDKVMPAQEGTASAPDSGFLVEGPFDSLDGPKDPRCFLNNVTKTQIPVVLYAYGLAGLFPSLDKRLSKFVNDDDPNAGETGFDEEGYQIVTKPGAAMHSKAAEQRKKRKAEETPSMADVMRESTSELAAAVRTLAPSAPKLSTRASALDEQLAAERAQHVLLLAQHKTVLETYVTMSAQKELIDELQELKQELAASTALVKATAAKIACLAQERDTARQFHI